MGDRERQPTLNTERNSIWFVKPWSTGVEGPTWKKRDHSCSGLIVDEERIIPIEWYYLLHVLTAWRASCCNFFLNTQEYDDDQSILRCRDAGAEKQSLHAAFKENSAKFQLVETETYNISPTQCDKSVSAAQQVGPKRWQNCLTFTAFFVGIVRTFS